MPTTARSTFGLTLTRAGNLVAYIRLIGGPKLKADSIETTNHDSADGYEEAIQGIKRTGEVNMEGIFKADDTNGQIGLLTDFNAGTVAAYVITFPVASATSWTFDAFVIGFELDDASVNGVMGFKATLKVTGKPVLGLSASTGLTTTFFAVSGSAVITPAPANAVYDYTANVLTAVASVTVTPVATAGVITVNGNIVATGQASSAIALGAAGSITIVTVKVVEVGKTAKTYTIRVIRGV